MSEHPRYPRPRYPMPPEMEAALQERGPMEVYQSRPAYQQNDYIGWITSAKRQETPDKPLAQMLDELAGAGRDEARNDKHPCPSTCDARHNVKRRPLHRAAS
ncbi:MAG: YdeI/OmpD-associated family protein [Dehalococcoidia bacterium]